MDLVDRLAQHKTLGAAPREELAWLAAHGSLRHMNTGDVLTAKGAQVAGLFVVLLGLHRHIRRSRRWAEQDHGMAGRRHHGHAPVLPPRQPAGRFGGTGTHEMARSGHSTLKYF
jgi:hypothetical protein